MPKINCPQPENQDAIARIQENANYHFTQPDVLLEALTHPSYAAEHGDPNLHNQRLEFLGDAVLQIILSDYIFHHLPQEQEGVLTRIRSFLANEQATAQYAVTLQLDQALKLGHGEDRHGGRQRTSIQGDLFEAFLGAIYLDGGMQPARQLVLKLLPDLDYCLKKLTFDENPKGSLQRFCQEHFKQNVHYEITGEAGPEHNRSYTAQALLEDRVIGTGTGKSHKDAERHAAAQALEQLAKVHVTQEELPIPMAPPEPPKKTTRKILALDFDGVLCNSMAETAHAAWTATRSLWPELARQDSLPPDLQDQFAQARPYLEIGYQSILMMKLFLQGRDASYFRQDFTAKITRAVQESHVKVSQLIQAFGDARDQAMNQDLNHWISLHAFYPGTLDALRQAMQLHKVLILTTKQERFIAALLKSQNLDFPQEAIFGLDRKLSKDAVLANLVGAKKTNIHFVEDRLDTLLRIQQSKPLARVKLHYAPWGYGTPEQLDEAQRNPRIDVLTPQAFQELLAH